MSSAQLKKFAKIKPADLEWRDGLPYSREFNDVYFSSAGGLAETRHVFIAGNRLTSDWSRTDHTAFQLVELGFGSGLNFLATAMEWQKFISNDKAHPNKHLHYLAIEKRPFAPDDLKQACQHWPKFADLAHALLANYPSLTYGRHTLQFKALNLTLTLIFMPVDEALDDLIAESQMQQHKTQIDHWFLDGFAPQKNEAMWSEITCQKIAQLCKPGSRIATFSVAATVKNALKSAGFQLEKRQGIGKKREVLSAEFVSYPQAPAANKHKAPAANKNQPPVASKHINIRFEHPWLNIGKSEPIESVAIIGAGLAGCATAYTLARRGHSVTLFESGLHVASQASGVAAGIFHPTLTSDLNLGSQFSWLAYLYLSRFLNQLTREQQDSLDLNWGLTRLLPSNTQRNQLLALSHSIGIEQWIKTPDKAIDSQRAVEFPFCGTLNIGRFCQLLISQIPADRLRTQFATKVNSLERRDNRWQVITAQQSQSFDAVVLAGGANSSLLEKIAPALTHISRGQSCELALPAISDKITKPLCEQIYLVPGNDDRFYLGATFDDCSDEKFIAQLMADSQIELLNKLQKLLRELNLPLANLSDKASIPLQGSLGYRLHTQDRLPLIGAAVDSEKLIQDFAGLGQKRIERNLLSEYNVAGLWLNTAYGSHGLLYSLIASEHLAALMNNGISPIDSSLAKILHPARFEVKKLRQ